MESSIKEISEIALVRIEQIWLLFACRRVFRSELIHSQESQVKKNSAREGVLQN